MIKTSWCWLPSLSGRVFEEQNDFRTKLVEYGEDGDLPSEYGFEIAESANEDALVTIIARFKSDSYQHRSEIGPRDIIVDVMDERGLCRLTHTSAREHELYDAWKTFRIALDGCSETKFNCSSMKLPVVVKADEKPHMVLARIMLESVETNADIIAYSAGKSFRWTKKDNPVCNPRAECDSNVLYFNAFMDHYKKWFEEDDWSRLSKEMDRRAKKMEMAQRHVDCRERHWFNRTTVILSITAITVSVIAAIITAIMSLT